MNVQTTVSPGNLIRSFILRILDGELSETDRLIFSNWMNESRVARYYFERLLSLEMIVGDLEYLAEKWHDPIETEAWRALKSISESQGIKALQGEAVPDLPTFLQFQNSRADEMIIQHGDSDYLISEK